MKFKNNPANIRYNPRNYWKGQIEPLRGFCQFSDLKFGLRALMVLLKNYIKKKKCHSVQTIISRFAPVSENNTCGYIRFLCNLLHGHDCDSNHITPFSESFYWLCIGICYYETNTSIDIKDLMKVAKEFGLWSDCLSTINKQLMLDFKD